MASSGLLHSRGATTEKALSLVFLLYQQATANMARLEDL